MDIYLDFIKGSKFLCPVCNELCPIHDTKENHVLKNTRFMWLKNPDRLLEKENVIMESIKNLDTKTAKAYQFRLALQRLWTIKEISVAREYLDKWHYWGTHSNIP